MDLQLKNKKVLITGGTRGIGKSIAEVFANEGCDISICSRDLENVNSTIEDISQRGVKTYGETIDVKNFDDLTLWVKRSGEFLGGIDIYISNVSAQSFDWEKSFEIDVLGSVMGVNAALPFLKDSDHASIVAIASKAASLSVPSYKPYSAMKAALISYMSSLSRELAPFGIRVNCVSPGEIYFKGGFWERIKHEDPKLYNATLKNNPMTRFGTPEEVARGVLFLASPMASYISGTNLLIDGAGREHVQF